MDLSRGAGSLDRLHAFDQFVRSILRELPGSSRPLPSDPADQCSEAVSAADALRGRRMASQSVRPVRMAGIPNSTRLCNRLRDLKLEYVRRGQQLRANQSRPGYSCGRRCPSRNQACLPRTSLRVLTNDIRRRIG
jgi:hypothetical protein